MVKKRSQSVGQTIGGIIAGFDQQIFRTAPPAKVVGSPALRGSESDTLSLDARGVHALIDLAHGGRLATLVVDGRELLVTDAFGPTAWGSFPMAPFAGRVRDGAFTFRGRRWQLAIETPPHALHGTVLNRRWHLVDDRTIATELGPGWPFAGRVVQRFDLQEGCLGFRLEVHADEPMPASAGWHPWFLRRPAAASGASNPGAPSEPVELDLDAGAMYRRDADGIATTDRVVTPQGPWDDCFTDLRRPPVLRWPGFLELTIHSDCRDWVVYTVPSEALCVEPQTAPPDALNTGAAIVEPGRPLIAEMTWTWRSLAG